MCEHVFITNAGSRIGKTTNNAAVFFMPDLASTEAGAEGVSWNAVLSYYKFVELGKRSLLEASALHL